MGPILTQDPLNIEPALKIKMVRPYKYVLCMRMIHQKREHFRIAEKVGIFSVSSHNCSV